MLARRPPHRGPPCPISANLFVSICGLHLRSTGLFGKMNVEHRTSNAEHRIMMSLRSAI
jgi:hypothetical protein